MTLESKWFAHQCHRHHSISYNPQALLNAACLGQPEDWHARKKYLAHMKKETSCAMILFAFGVVVIGMYCLCRCRCSGKKERKY